MPGCGREGCTFFLKSLFSGDDLIVFTTESDVLPLNRGFLVITEYDLKEEMCIFTPKSWFSDDDLIVFTTEFIFYP